MNGDLANCLPAFLAAKGVAEPATLVLACSGGADSMVLLHLAQQLQGYSLVVAHVNYGLRGIESDGDEALVRHYCKKNKLRLVVLRRRYPARPVPGNVQAWARRVRYLFFKRLLKKHHATAVLVAHHAHDQLETMLHHLGKGHALPGLAGMQPGNGALLRPLLLHTKAEILAYARQHQVPWREDSSNASTKYLRNQLRHTVLPPLQQAMPQVVQASGSSCVALQQQWQWLQQAFDQALAACQVPDAVPHYQLGAYAHLPLQPLLWYLLRPFGFGRTRIALAAAALTGSQLSTFQAKQWTCLVQGWNLQIVAHSWLQAQPKALLLLGQGTVSFGPYSFRVAQYDGQATNGKTSVVVPRHLAPLQLHMGYPAGSRMRPFGMRGSRLLSDVVSEGQVPAWARHLGYPTLMAGNTPLWLPGLRSAEACRIHPGQPALHITVILPWHKTQSHPAA